MKGLRRLRLSHTQVIAGGFLLLILLGTVLLSLPVSSQSGEATPFFDALFTATSASCVTGLSVLDTGNHWSLFGQVVLLLLIQTGGLGFMTFITFFLMAVRTKLGLRERELMTESVSAGGIGGIRGLTGTILIGTGFFEALGALLLSFRFIPQFGWAKGIWFSVFHSVSAFCNAGFDLLGNYTSFVGYASDPLVSLTLMALILIGGTGFPVWDDLWKNRRHLRRVCLQTKTVLAMNLILVSGGAVLFLIFERDNLGRGQPFGTQLLEAFFDSVTARTAGFNTTDTSSLSTPSLLLTCILMMIGGGSGSTAGGIKLNTIAVLAAFAVAGLKREEEATLFGRSIGEDTLKSALSVCALNLSLALGGGLLIGAIQPLALSDLLFEVCSAIGTVGMTTGITRSLLPASRAVLILLMYLGRVGSVSFALALFEKRARPAVRCPKESLAVG